ncbi:Hydroxyacylglutathione hydrolase [Hydrogenovibrio crunogenus]|uniref:Hydroxyacylglutathione hydrolase n=1 Tax=Hydrogenovibrio crunogenus TaxID=39765 RepID=A0A4P7NZ38_9GAMM|nr:hydroxyacylglutathione hydrolase [Hydrogenovibrio crunogenus]QBZ82948.1 Hydroxyacylglutathione hydrolase [Hydrogenovibrio crunogenus]RUM92133.1 MAG: hydroxyacylglutathione hydrolase [Thiomicrospira sp.]
MKIVGLPTLSDNYTWVIQSEDAYYKHAWIVDPGESQKVIQYFEENQLQLDGILLTHHHYDHTDGIHGVLKALGEVPVVSNAKGPFKPVTHSVKEGDKVQVLNETFRVIETPGHTDEHICFYHPEALFSGDTLFTGGCGKIWQNPPEQMAESLLKLRALNDDCMVYCGHEYTYANLNFANIAEPNTSAILDRLADVKTNTQRGIPCVPARLGLEKQTNPFLRFDLPPLRQTLMAKQAQPNESMGALFATLRAWKDELDQTNILEAGLND